MIPTREAPLSGESYIQEFNFPCYFACELGIDRSPSDAELLREMYPDNAKNIHIIEGGLLGLEIFLCACSPEMLVTFFGIQAQMKEERYKQLGRSFSKKEIAPQAIAFVVVTQAELTKYPHAYIFLHSVFQERLHIVPHKRFRQIVESQKSESLQSLCSALA